MIQWYNLLKHQLFYIISFIPNFSVADEIQEDLDGKYLQHWWIIFKNFIRGDITFDSWNKVV